MSKTVALLGTLLLVSVVGAMTLLSGCIEPGDNDSPTGRYLSPEEIKALEDQAREGGKTQPTSSVIHTGPSATPEPTPTPEQPIEIKDSDGDGVPDHEDYDPRTPIGADRDVNRDGALDTQRDVFEYGEGARDELRLRGLLNKLEEMYPEGIKNMEILYHDSNFDMAQGGTWDEVDILINGEHLASFRYVDGNAVSLYTGIGAVLDPEKYYGGADMRID